MFKWFIINELIFYPKTNHTVKNGFFICITEKRGLGFIGF
jgi:hypothetical protein